MLTYGAFLLIVAGSSRAVADDTCTVNSFPDVINTAENVSPGGGVLVATKENSEGTCPADATCRFPGAATDASNQPTWRFNFDDKLVEPVRTTLAPGLTSYMPPKGATKIRLETSEHARKAELAVTGNAKVLDAPKLKRVFHYDQPRGKFQVIAEATDYPPDGVAALIIYGSDGNARDWRPVQAGRSKQIEVAHDPDKCEMPFPGRAPTKVGDKVRFAWVDRSGRVSPKSDEFEVVIDTPSPKAVRPPKKSLRPGF